VKKSYVERTPTCDLVVLWTRSASLPLQEHETPPPYSVIQHYVRRRVRLFNLLVPLESVFAFIANRTHH
jgi:hypothetical protein